MVSCKYIKSIKEICDEKKLSISVSESLTSGLIQSKLASVSGSSSFFVGGLTVYNIDQKCRLLNVDYDHANEVNCVSQKVADEMAIGCLNLYRSDISISVTGYAEPYGDIKKPFCYFSIYYKGDKLYGDKIISEVDSRNHNREYFSHEIIKVLNKTIKNI